MTTREWLDKILGKFETWASRNNIFQLGLVNVWSSFSKITWLEALELVHVNTDPKYPILVKLQYTFNH